jgi:hypothetical protein
MPQPSLQLIPTQRKEDAKKQRLRGVIEKKRTLLEKLVIKTETLRMNLDMARQEYMVKVGSLFFKDNQLDLEIIQLRNVLNLMEKGFTHDAAVNQIASTYYAEQLEIEREQEKIRFEEEMYQKREAHQPQPGEDIKRLWKKLIARFHPDLVLDPDEKKKRDEIMKMINRAYQEADYDTLMKIDQENLTEQEQTVDNLEGILIRLMKEIIQQTQLYIQLKKSEWYDWMIKIERAKKKNINIFADTERHLLNDIVAKLDLIKELKQQIEKKEKHS